MAKYVRKRRYVFDPADVDEATSDLSMCVGGLRFQDLGRTGIRVETTERNVDGDGPASVIPREIAVALMGLPANEKAAVAEWLRSVVGQDP